ncbi:MULTISPECIES: tetratricopeptide repeat-containing serine protease family protein [unclassified Dolichospermum]|uniref:tetratricopeptide repeat-containing S1 family peptidase n=1 Tax=unclassified Dolichospermum TaxID=2622029 RepID=UPI00144583C7|nr:MULTISPECIES: tetratricopeptide repeat-containing serine protease family protein [unclassified Dolichospermum]MTJ17774.1 serine protease [Dolichospermum sp. UHCC 0299]MTJ38122.1 serine protease [Dolichospermum sp. UHCC 0406]
MNYKYTFPAVLIGVSIALVQTQVAFALSSGQVAKIAKQITVLIDSSAPGSGVIVKRSGNTYTVLTAAHVVTSKNKAEIVTPDGKRYQLNYSTVKPLPGVDLATFQFTSSNNYPVAKIGNSDQSSEGTIAYVAGFPKAKAASISSSIYNFTDGKITANASRPLKDGYALVYSNITLPGMSGGPVFNEQGELIGVHGKGDESEAEIATSKINPEVAYIKSGFNLGIPINTFLRLSAKSGVDVGVTPPPERVVTAPKADDFFIQGLDKQNKGDNRGAIVAYNEAIRLNPNNDKAYGNRGIVRNDLGDKQGAIADYNQVIRINPNDALAYNNRGIVRNDLGDKQGAIADYNLAIKINPNLAQVYNNRGIAKAELGDKQAAIQDFNQAIKINPNYAPAYNNRGVAKAELGDKQAAIQDFNQAIKINPNYAPAYNNRGNFRYKLGDKQAAIDDFNQVIKFNPNLALAYIHRGIVRYKLGDKQAAISDFQQAANLFHEQGNTEGYQKVLEVLRKIQP